MPRGGDRGAEPRYCPEHGRRILTMLDQAPPAGYSNWTAPLLARVLVDIHEQYIWRFLRAQKIDLSGRKSKWCESTVFFFFFFFFPPPPPPPPPPDPEFVSEGGGHCWPLYGAARQRGRAVDR